MGSKFVNAEGNVVEGSVMLEEKIVTPTDTQQVVTPSLGCVLSKVIVDAVESGGGIDTCTVTISTCTEKPFGHDVGSLIYETIENEEKVIKRIDGELYEISIVCICNSLLIVNETTERVDHTYLNLLPIESDNYSAFVDTNIRAFVVTAPANGAANLVIDVD